MDLGAVMDELGDQLDTIDGLRVYRWPPGSVSAPAAVVSFPERVEFDATYRRATDRMTVPIVVLVGKPSERGSRDKIAGYCGGSGESSIKQVLEAGTYTAFGSLRVVDAEFDVVTIGTADYLAATFAVEITGGGSS